MNIWHDIDKKRISPEKFITYIEISKGSKMKYELDKETGLLRLDRYYIHQLTIQLIMDLFQELMHLMMIHWTFL